MTVKEAIEKLQKMENKEMAILVDCPHCGRAGQFEFVDECVVLWSPPPK